MSKQFASENPGPIGLVGLGLMGEAIAVRLIAGGHRVVGHDIAPSRRHAFQALGGEVAEGPADVAATCVRMMLSLPGSPEVAAVLAAMEPALRAGQIVLDTTTGDPEVAEAAADRLSGRGVSYLDASISGSSVQVRTVEAT
ncbi:MAG: NAD(P)-binding domain-containing protein, partial [Thermoleophilia bacterium]|nr:NAD(P)-binding domain-containing protein [Thermoleophilia bacterium]